jgi:hypothetical protein
MIVEREGRRNRGPLKAGKRFLFAAQKIPFKRVRQRPRGQWPFSSVCLEHDAEARSCVCSTELSRIGRIKGRALTVGFAMLVPDGAGQIVVSEMRRAKKESGNDGCDRHYGARCGATREKGLAVERG